MPFAGAKRDVAKSIKTLLVVLQSMRDQQVTITLRNDSIVRGTIVKVDANMNIELRDAVIELDPFYCTVAVPQTSGNASTDDSTSEIEDDLQVSHHDNQVIADEASVKSDDDSDESDSPNTKTMPFFLVKGSRIRHVDVPNNFEPVTRAKQEIERLRNRTKAWTKKDIVRRPNLYDSELVGSEGTLKSSGHT